MGAQIMANNLMYLSMKNINNNNESHVVILRGDIRLEKLDSIH